MAEATTFGRSLGSRSEAPAATKAKPIKVWAWIGAVFLALEAYVFGAWFISGKATRTPIGPDEVPTFMEVAAWTAMIGGGIVALVMIYRVLIRPIRQEGRISNDGLLVIACLLLYWQDPLFNYAQNWGTINAVFPNLGSWTTNVPGWISPDGNLYPEVPFWIAPMYVYVMLGMAIVANGIMRGAKRRWPEIGTIGLVGICFAFIVGMDVFLEVTFMRLGLYSYPGAIEELTLFHGNYYQYPLYEGVFWGAWWTGLACLRFFRDDKGRTVVERGVDQIKTTRRRQTGLRLLALVGATNVIMLVGYNFPIQIFAMHSDPWPEDVTSRSYLTNGFCGEGTDTACPGPRVPINRSDSLRFTPEGKVIDPTTGEIVGSLEPGAAEILKGGP